VAIGEGSDVQLLENIAKLAKGRFYYTNDQSTLPAILSRETVMMSRTYVVDQPFVPALGQLGDWAGLFSKGVPRINAYVAATSKETAEVSLLSPEPDPLLARWQYGSGRAVAWTSDFSGKWSADWIAWDQFSNVFSQIVKWTFPQFESTPFELSTQVNGSEVALGIKGSAVEKTGDIKATVTDELLTTTELTVTPTLPGEYEATMAITKPGVYLTKIDVPGDETKQQPPTSATTGFVIPYSPEYRIDSGDQTTKLKQLAELTGGRLLSLEHPEEVFQGAVKPRKQSHSMSRLLIIVSLLLWLLDIAIRRLSVPWERLFTPFTWGYKRLRPRIAGGVGTIRVERLQQRKRVNKAFIRADAKLQDQKPGSAATAANTASNLLSVLELGAAGEAVSTTASQKRQDPADKQAETQQPDNSQTMNRLLAAKNRKRH
jgi:Ca-activated chloride channel homolog